MFTHKYKSETKMFHFSENNNINSVGTDFLSVFFGGVCVG